MKNWWKYSGILLMITAVFHCAMSFVKYRDSFVEILHMGIFNSVKGSYSHLAAFWFLICGIMLFAMGHTLHFYIKKEQKPLPLFFGYYLLIISAFGIILAPVSGFWLIVPQALIIIFAKQRK